MKKINILIAAILLTTALTGCGKAKPVTHKQTTKAQVETTETQTEKPTKSGWAIKSDEYTSGLYEDKEYKKIRGRWMTESGTVFEFNKNGKYKWYKSRDNKKDNYYKGDIVVYSGYSAQKDLNIEFDQILEVSRMSDGKVGCDDIFSIHTYPTYLISGGVDKTKTLTDEFNMKLMFIYVDKNNAQGYNYTTGDKYIFRKIK